MLGRCAWPVHAGVRVPAIEAAPSSNLSSACNARAWSSAFSDLPPLYAVIFLSIISDISLPIVRGGIKTHLPSSATGSGSSFYRLSQCVFGGALGKGEQGSYV